ncbi:MAG: hypothetical protein AAF961_00670, partial [Planctomycetota bacterium]
MSPKPNAYLSFLSQRSFSTTRRRLHGEMLRFASTLSNCLRASLDTPRGGIPLPSARLTLFDS